MLQVEQARTRILTLVRPLSSRMVPLREAAGFFLATPVTAPLDLPLFDNSAMDGYAVRAQDVSGASSTSPVPLSLAGKIAAGEPPSLQLQEGTCIRVFTGSPLPAGADAVVMQEDIRIEPDHPDRILVCDRVKPWENIRFQGEDIRKGTLLLEPGFRITAAAVAVLASLGQTEVPVIRRPVVGFLATGNELLEPGSPLTPGQIYESNRTALAALAAPTGCVTRFFPIVPDSLQATKSALQEALAECDVLVSSGGVSVGEFDYVKQALQEIGGTLDFWKIAMKPGKPFVFGHCQDKLLFGLPGNPVSSLVTFLLLVQPALLRLQGARHVEPPTCQGITAETLENRGDRRHFMRVQIGPDDSVRSAGLQASHAFSSLLHANGLVDLPPNTAIPAGQPVRVIRFLT